ncbi:MAG: alpha-isopropylmalate synthase regulatory domain-containing protein [Coriobacteriales bacterium]
MRDIQVCDITMKQAVGAKTLSLSFKDKLELAKQLDKIGVSAVEVEGIESPKADSLRIKSLASLVKNCTLTVPVSLEAGSAEQVWSALQDAKAPRLQLEVAVSPANMEYIHHRKADAMLADVERVITECRALCSDVEFVAADCTRADEAYLRSIISAAIQAGATTVTLADAAGKMLPEEFAQFITAIKSDLPQLEDVCLGISCSNELFMADACAVAAVAAGVDMFKGCTYPLNAVSLDNVCKILATRQDACQVGCSVRTTEINRAAARIAQIIEKDSTRFGSTPLSELEDIVSLSAQDSQDTIAAQALKLGYELSEEDIASVYKAFKDIVSKKKTINSVELDTIIAAVAMQVPPTYLVESYTINSGNKIKATAHIVLTKNGEELSAVCAGDGPIDAAFMAIEEIIGHHYELDDFKLRSLTEGQEAVGEALIKLICDGKVYSGRGVSTDIVGSSIHAFINTVNKIVYEEQ